MIFYLEMESNIENFLKQSADKCQFFRIGKDNNFYFKRGNYQYIPLVEFDRDILLEMLEEIECNVYNKSTLENIKQIRKEIYG